MKTKFFLMTFLLLFSRGCDYYSTSLWFFENPSGEQNWLYRFLGFGWTGMWLSNVLIVGLIIYSFYFYTFKYQIGVTISKPNTLKEYISERYYGKRGHFFQVFYKPATDKMTFWGHMGYVLIRMVIIGSFLATIHNLCQYYNIAWYNNFREVAGRPLYVIYGLIGLSFVYFNIRLWKKEFYAARMEFERHPSSSGLSDNSTS